jgi:hypothetical protein
LSGIADRKIMWRFFQSPIAWTAVLLAASAQSASAQQCPLNSHAAAVAIPGNLRTAQCFCNDGFTPVNGICVRIVNDPGVRPLPADPGKTFVAPKPFR